MAKILISCGPIPAKLDSVKVITNRFKGGLSFKTAEMLANLGHEITIIRWIHLPMNMPRNIHRVVDITDIYDYMGAVLNTEADVYVMSAAVANLMPSNPLQGKFPSHSYRAGERFNIEFEIAPRIIDEIKKHHPTSGLVGYKLFDGPESELIEAGWETLINSKANMIFANHPKTAKEYKIMLTSDGAEIPMSFDEHVRWIDYLAITKFYKTIIKNERWPDTINIVQKIADIYPKYEKHGMTFGTFAVRYNDGFFTTTRGKKDWKITYISNVDHENLVIETAPSKATLNAPLLDMILKLNPDINILIHGHQKLGVVSHPYQLPGTTNEVKLAMSMNFKNNIAAEIQHHGYIAAFETIKECVEWMEKYGKE